jgi:hypothetical protein
MVETEGGYQNVTEDWRINYEKYILARKLSLAASTVGMAAGNPEEETVRAAFSSVYDYVTNLPVGNDDFHKKTRFDLYTRLDEINLVLFGNPNDERVAKLMRKFKVQIRIMRQGVRAVPMRSDLPRIVAELRDILNTASDWAYGMGLRFTKPDKFKGMEKVENEEGFSEDDTDDIFRGID